MIKKIKEAIVRRSVTKRKKNSTFNDLLSESYELPENAAADQNNSYYFSAHNASGESLFLRLGKRGGGAHEVWFAYYSKDGTAFVNSENIFNAENCPVTLKCVTPLKEWEIYFDGKMRCAKADDSLVLQPYGDELDATFKGRFVCTEKLYEFSRDSDERPFARAVAAEKWSKEFFAELNQNTQVHTEQSGRLDGNLSVSGKDYAIDSPAMRDHSFGKREWGYMNRHIWLMSVSENENVNVNMVSYPALRGLRTGYSTSEGVTVNVTDATPMGKMPSTGGIPQNFTYNFKLKNGKTYTGQCKPSAAFKFVMGDGSYTIYEGIADYIIDGKQGRGIAEFGYNSDETRWKN